MKIQRILLAGFLLVSPAEADNKIPVPSPSTQIIDRYGVPLRTIFVNELSHPVSLESLSPWIILTTLAAEDKRFFSHSGVDFQSALRALWQNTKEGRIVSGGSTISQQLVRLLEPRSRTFLSKTKEAFKAWFLETRSKKRDILEAYLNNAFYGNLAKGIEAASQTYLGVPSRDLSLAQAALLAGIPKSPAKYDPVRHMENALVRQKTVLKRLLDWKWLDKESYRLALSERIKISTSNRVLHAPHFTEYLRRTIPSPGTWRTTLDVSLQRDLEGLLVSHLSRLIHNHVTNGAIIVIDNATGDVLSWIGSADFFDTSIQGQVDGITALRQPGSALKPFVYGLAFSKGVKASDILDDTPLFTSGGYTPKNYDNTFHGHVRAREALACSYNIPAVRLGEKLGVPTVLNSLRAFGFESLTQSADKYGAGLVLGNGEVTLLELTNAYATLARNGVWKPVNILIEKAYIGENSARRVLDRESAYIVTSILSDNSARSSAFSLNSPLHLPFPFAAKTGTTKDYRDNWAIGYTTEWTIGVWVGNFDGKSMRRVSGITGAAPILHDVALVVAEEYPSGSFNQPSTIREREICPASGKISGPWCYDTIIEIFSSRHLPDKLCDMHGPEKIFETALLQKPVIEFPKDGDVFKLDPVIPADSQAIRIRANVERLSGAFRWWLDSQELNSRESYVWWPLKQGKHEVRFVYTKEGKIIRSTTVAFMVIP